MPRPVFRKDPDAAQLVMFFRFFRPLDRSTCLGAVVWCEALALFCAGWFLGERWLIPAAGLVALFAGLVGPLPRLGVLSGLGLPLLWAFLLARLPHAPGAASFGIGALLIGAGYAFLQILFFAGDAGKTDRLATMRSCLLRLLVLVHFAFAGALLAEAYLSGGFRWWLAGVAGLLSIVLAAESLARMARRMFTPPRHWDSLAEPGEFSFYRWLGPEWRAALPPAPPADDEFRLRLAEMWMLPSLQRGLPVLLLAAAALAWLSTSLHVVPAGSEGLRNTFGRWANSPIPAGLQLSLPWPLGGISVIDTGKLREVVLGFQADPGKPILWERAHYLEEQMSMVGGGDDYLSISVPVLYRIADPGKYLRSARDAEGVLRAVADRALLQLTASLPGELIMTTSRETLRVEMKRLVQMELDHLDTGLAVSEVYLRDIHPPVPVAPTFQDVVGAMEDREAFVNEAEAYRRGNRLQAIGTASAILVNAQSGSAVREAQSAGQTRRFLALQAAWAQAPELYQWRETFRVIDETLSGAKKAIVDSRLRGTAAAQIDLRRVLNPDLIERADPRPDTLVPGAAKSRDAFDLDIEGFQRMGKGEVPAMNFAPEDSDNLLEKATQPAP